MRNNAIKEFFSQLLEKIKRIDKKWIPAMALGGVAVIAAVSVGIAAIVDVSGNGGQNGSQTSAGGGTAGVDQYTMPAGQGGEDGSIYSPEEISGALDALKDAIKKNGNKIHFKNPFANIKIPTTKSKPGANTTTKPSQSNPAGTSNNNPSNVPPATNAPETSTPPETESQTTEPGATTPAVSSPEPAEE